LYIIAKFFYKYIAATPEIRVAIIPEKLRNPKI